MGNRKTSMIIDPIATAKFSKTLKVLASKLTQDQINLTKANNVLYETHKDEQYKSMEPLINDKIKRIKQLVVELEQFAKYLDVLSRKGVNYITAKKIKD